MSLSSNNNNYFISLLEGVIVSFCGLDSSNSQLCSMAQNKLDMTQDWINSINGEFILADINGYNNIETIDLKKLRLEVFSFRLPSIDVIHNLSLSELNEYETMLIEFIDIYGSNVHLNVNILLHMKIIQNHQIYKFHIFE